MSQKIATIPHSREGDYENIMMITMIPFEEKDFDLLESAVPKKK